MLQIAALYLFDSTNPEPYIEHFIQRLWGRPCLRLLETMP